MIGISLSGKMPESQRELIKTALLRLEIVVALTVKSDTTEESTINHRPPGEWSSRNYAKFLFTNLMSKLQIEIPRNKKKIFTLNGMALSTCFSPCDSFNNFL